MNNSNTANLEFRSQCRIFRLGNDILKVAKKQQTKQQQQHGVYPRGAGKRKSSYDDEALAPGRKGDPQLYVVGKIVVCKKTR